MLILSKISKGMQGRELGRLGAFNGESFLCLKVRGESVAEMTVGGAGRR